MDLVEYDMRFVGCEEPKGLIHYLLFARCQAGWAGPGFIISYLAERENFKCVNTCALHVNVQ